MENGIGKVKLLALKEGDIFIADSVEYIVLEQFDNGRTAVIRKEELKESMVFGPNNNWKKGKVRNSLNGDYLKELAGEFGDENIVAHTVNLTSLDGLKDYGESVDKVSILDINQYRRYRKNLMEAPDCFWFLATPDSTPSGCGEYNVLHVASDGDVGVDMCCSEMHARPYFILDSSVLVTAEEELYIEVAHLEESEAVDCFHELEEQDPDSAVSFLSQWDYGENDGNPKTLSQITDRLLFVNRAECGDYMALWQTGVTGVTLYRRYSEGRPAQEEP